MAIAVVVGQKREAVERWVENHPMPFPVLIDEQRSVIKAFDVYHPLGIDAFRIAHPSLFLLSEDQNVVYAYVGKNQKDRPSQDETYEKVHQYLARTLDE